MSGTVRVFPMPKSEEVLSVDNTEEEAPDVPHEGTVSTSAGEQCVW